MYITGVGNDTADALSRLDLTDKVYDHITWGEKNKQLKYVDVQMMNMCMFMSESNFDKDGFDSDVLMTMLDTQDHQ